MSQKNVTVKHGGFESRRIDYKGEWGCRVAWGGITGMKDANGLG